MRGKIDLFLANFERLFRIEKNEIKSDIRVACMIYFVDKGHLLLVTY